MDKEKTVALPAATKTKAEKNKNFRRTSGGGSGNRMAMERRLCDAIENGIGDEEELYAVFFEARKNTTYQSDRAAFERYLNCSTFKREAARRGLQID